MAKQRDYKREYQMKLARGENLKSKVIGLRLNNDVFADFFDTCERNGKTPTEVLREYVNDYILKTGYKISLPMLY